MVQIDGTIEKIYKESLGVKKGEKILIIGDFYDSDKNSLLEREFIADGFKKVAEQLGYKAETFFYSNVNNHGEEPPIELWVKCLGESFCNDFFKNNTYKHIKSKLLKLEDLLKYKEVVDKENFPDIVIAVSYYSTSHTIFRKLLNHLGCRYASMPMVEKEMFVGPLNIDYNELEKRTLTFAKKLEGFKAVHIRNNLGTNVTINFEGSKINCDTGNLKAKGSFGNLPAGEVYLPPQLSNTNGKICIEYFNGKRLNEFVFMHFKEGVVDEISGNSEITAQLNKILKDERNRVIAELGFGTNKNAKNPANVLEAEKIDGTCHIAIGDNITFGGKNIASVHIDFVINNPELRWIG